MRSGGNQPWWRWVGLILVVALLANGAFVPWFITALVLAGGGGYVLVLGWQVWSGGGMPLRRREPRVTYWRGQRIVLDDEPPPRGGPPALPPLRSIGPAVGYLVVGGALLLTGIALTLRHFGL